MIIASLHAFIFFSHKSEVFKFFKEFQSFVERLFNQKIIAMQTDWGGEYGSCVLPPHPSKKWHCGT
jgi:hypothetical protein